MTELQEKILELKKKGLSIAKIVSETGASQGVVKYVFTKKFQEHQKNIEAKKKADEEFEKLVVEYLPVSNSLNDLCKNLGLKGVDGYYKKINKIIQKHNLSTNHFGTIKKNKVSRNIYTKMSDDEFFTKDSNRNGRSIIQRLIEGRYKHYECEICGINEWRDKPLSLQIHHINGDHYDNRLNNLQILCPNCHTQTDNYCSKNSKAKGFKISKRTQEIVNGLENGMEIKSVDKIKQQIMSPKEKKYCLFCGKEMKNNNDKYCSIECAQKASRKYEITAEQIIADFKELKSFSAVGRKYGVTDNAIKKRTKILGVYDKIREYITPR